MLCVISHNGHARSIGEQPGENRHIDFSGEVSPVAGLVAEFWRYVSLYFVRLADVLDDPSEVLTLVSFALLSEPVRAFDKCLQSRIRVTQLSVVINIKVSYEVESFDEGALSVCTTPVAT